MTATNFVSIYPTLKRNTGVVITKYVTNNIYLYLDGFDKMIYNIYNWINMLNS